MNSCSVRSLLRSSVISCSATPSQLVAFACYFTLVLLASRVAAKGLYAGHLQEKEKKPHALRWDPPRVDAPILSLSAMPACSLPEVLKTAGQRAEELVNHLQNFIAHEQIRYEQMPSLSMAGPAGITGIGAIPGQSQEISFTGKFDYIVDFGKRSEPLHIREHRTPLKGTVNANLDAIVGKGLPALALIFHPSMQNDYEMSCEGFSPWNNQPAWVVDFSQRKGKRPRTVTMETASELAPHDPNTREIRPLRLKGRAWIAADSGQVMHLETNLLEKIPLIELEESAFSVDYAPVKFRAQNVEVWLPQFAIGYTDYAGRRMIVEHTFSDFQLFSVQTRDVIQKTPEP
ncbi:MAG: hypothetical protein WA621_15450 [Candidatus Acidiferrum sp.]